MVTETVTMTAVASNTEQSGDARVSQTAPTKADLDRVGDITLLDAKHQSILFKSLLPKDASHRTLVCFVRHFFCGYCQEFLRTLCSCVTPASLEALAQPTSVVIIGCGQPDLIDFYAEATNCPFPIYAEPSKKIYEELGMCRTLDLGPTRPDYQQKSMASMMLSSVSQATRAGRNAFKGGSMDQVGGEFLVQGDEVIFCHRMRNTRDHVEVPVLRKALGMADAPTPTRKKRASLAVPAPLVRRLSRSRSRSTEEPSKIQEEAVAA